MTQTTAAAPPRTSAVDVAAAAGLVVFWSSGFIGSRLGTEYAPADTLLAWRYLIAAAILLPIVAPRLLRVRRGALGRHAVVGLNVALGLPRAGIPARCFPIARSRLLSHPTGPAPARTARTARRPCRAPR